MHILSKLGVGVFLLLLAFPAFADITLTAPEERGVITPGGWSGHVIAGDIDQDGHADVAASLTKQLVGSELFFVKGNGDGTFQPVIKIALPKYLENISDMRFTRAGLTFSNDDEKQNKLFVYGPPLRYYGVRGGYPWQGIETFAEGDVNNDSIPDVVIFRPWNMATRLGKVTNGKATYGAPFKSTKYDYEAGYTNKARLADVDHDGMLDVISVFWQEHEVMPGLGGGTFTHIDANVVQHGVPVHDIVLTSSGLVTTDTVADMSATYAFDQWDDQLAAGGERVGGGGRFGIVDNNGIWAYIRETPVPVTSVALADFDENGVLDIIGIMPDARFVGVELR